MSELSIKVVIAGRSYPLTIAMEQEESIRTAARRIDERVQHLQSNYAVKDKQDLLAMSALQLAAEKTGMDHAIQTEVTDRISRLTRQLEAYLDEAVTNSSQEGGAPGTQKKHG